MTKSHMLDKNSLGIEQGIALEVSSGGVEELRKDIQRLMDIEAIKQLKHAYFRCIDTANWQELAEICHDDIAVHYVGGDYEMQLHGRQQVVSVLEQAFHNDAVGHHNGMQPEIQILSESQATGLWYLYDHFWSLNSKTLTKGTALYWDRYLKVDGRWMIKETNYERIYQINETLDSPPNFVSHYLSDHGLKCNSIT